MQLSRVLEGGGTPDSTYIVVGDDVAKLRSLRDAVVAMVNELAEHKKGLIRAHLDETPIEQIEAPHHLVERLIATIAPMVQEIAKRTLTPGELVLKRLLSDGHREELFVSKAELWQKIEPLSPALRRAFDPLGLWESAPPVHAVLTSVPEVAPAPPPPLDGHAQVTPQPVQIVTPPSPPPSLPPPAAQAAPATHRTSPRPPRP